MNQIRFQMLACLLLLSAAPTSLFAAVGDPVAVRQWPGGTVSFETHWGLEFVVERNFVHTMHRKRKPDRTIFPGEAVDHDLSRRPNSESAVWLPAQENKGADPNAMRVKTIRQLGTEPSLLIEVDGVRIIYVPDEWFAAQSNKDSITVMAQGITDPDLLILDTDSLDQLTSKTTLLLLKLVKPKAVLLNRINITDAPKIESLQDQFGAEQIVVQNDHNTIVVSKVDTDQPTQVLVIANTPWQMPESLSVLFGAMEKANENSQAVFANLSANQMNFKPANGTHTPRWNTEHMMGRQLLFFSQIYHAQNPAIPVIDLNPKQMPPDYVFAHPEWDGSEEARQMQRVSEFTRRFAYLLDGVELDKKAPGSRWTLRGLLKQMQRHYGEHTANTVKKFDLPGWPRE